MIAGWGYFRVQHWFSVIINRKRSQRKRFYDPLNNLVLSVSAYVVQSCQETEEEATHTSAASLKGLSFQKPHN